MDEWPKPGLVGGQLLSRKQSLNSGRSTSDMSPPPGPLPSLQLPLPPHALSLTFSLDLTPASLFNCPFALRLD